MATLGQSSHPWWRTGKGVIVRVRVTPKSSIDAIGGLEQTAEGPALKARVRAVPADGAANAAVAALLAERLGVAKSTIAVTGGAKSRVKLLTVAGEADMLESRLRTLAPKN